MSFNKYNSGKKTKDNNEFRIPNVFILKVVHVGKIAMSLISNYLIIFQLN